MGREGKGRRVTDEKCGRDRSVTDGKEGKGEWCKEKRFTDGK